ncbi:MAG TPA: cbb3-type cytochrome c oxidase subunit I, partial [Actinomycetota bacterium]|nr:cbb3-type cytochrome c oxidase subunit I [Actinomycetota bacterium]
IITTTFKLRAPGMSLDKMPLFAWAMLVTAFMIFFAMPAVMAASTLLILALPAVAAAVTMLLTDRHFGTAFFDPTAGGDPLLWQHLFWFFGHPEVYIVILPFFGVVSEIVPVFSRKPLFGYKGFVFATLLITAYSFSVWAHHMFTTGAVSSLFFATTSFLIAIPTGVKFFNWIATMWRGKLTFEAPMLFCMGFLFMFLIGGISGVFLASPPIDYAVHDTYYVVAHMHYVMFGGTTFAAFAGFYYWIPKFFGRLMGERLARLHFVLMLVGMNLAFFPMHQLGLDGMQRRIPDYPESAGYGDLNMLSTVGAFLIAASIAVFVVNFAVSMRRGRRAGDDPWNGYSLEWATSSPPPHHNFESLPPIRSERPVYDARHAADA